MTNSINKFKSLSNQVDIINAVYDLAIDFKGARTVATNTNESNAERINAWMNSERGDIVGNPAYGGFVKSMLGSILHSDNLDYYERTIKDRLQYDFNGEITVLLVKLLPQKATNSVVVNVVTIDNSTGRFDSLTTSIQ